MKTKKILIGAVASVVTLVMINSCVVRVGGKNTTTTTTEVTTSATSYLDKHLISQAKAKVLADEYVANNYQKINANSSKMDTREVYYDIEALEDYLDYVKKQAKAKGINDVGIVIAFGQYPKNKDFDAKLNPDYKGQQTVFLKPVLKDNSINYKTSKGGSTTSNLNDLSQIDAFDFGQLTPPEK